MPKRLHQTTGDYLAIAIGPALVMVLVWSLIAFLLEVFYQGEYGARLKAIMAMFVFGAVLIGRISIEEGKERASLFAIALGTVTALALWRFSEPHGGALSTVALPIDMALLGLIWWCAHKLVWDCTMIDDQQDASGEGLLATMGWEGSNNSRTTPIANASLDVERSALTVRSSSLDEQRGNQGTSNSQTPERSTVNVERPTSNQKPHAPGKWVIYFSLAALPVFGIGQLFIPESDLERRQYALRLMVQYVAAGLGLLLATSFLGLRRYLRQRHVQMPTKMAGGWAGAGAALIAAVLLFCLLIPRPSAELAMSSITGETASDFQTSRYAVGNDGPLRKEGDRTRASQDENAQGSGGGQQGGQSGNGDSKTGESKSGGNSQGQSGGGKSQSSQDNNSSDANNQNGDQRNGNQQGEENAGQSNGDKNEQQSGENSRDERQQDQQGDSRGQNSGGQNSGGQSSSRQDQGGGRDGESRAKREGTRSAESSSQRSSWSAGKWFGNTARWLFYAALLVLGAFLAWRYRREIAAAWRQFIADFKSFWAGLFGRKSKATEEGPSGVSADPAAHQDRAFAEYANPFLTGAAERRPPEEIVTYSFRALEAWGREHGATREQDLTPHEFAQRVARRADYLAADAGRLASLYSQVAYAPGTIDGRQVETLRPLWEGMEGRPQTAADQPNRPRM